MSLPTTAKKILLIEDDAKSARAVRAGLESEGYATAWASTGEDGFYRLNAEAFDRQMLAHEVWRELQRSTPLNNVIDVHIARLRRKIDDGAAVRLIHTVRGAGFVLREREPQGNERLVANTLASATADALVCGHFTYHPARLGRAAVDTGTLPA